MLARLSRLAFAIPLVALLAAPAGRADDAMAEVVSKDDFQIPDGISAKRRAVVQAALDEVGGTSSRPGKATGGKRYGADHLQKYIMAAFNWKQGQIPKDWQKKIDGIQTPTKPGERPHEVNNWCGFFVTYALKTGRAAPASMKWAPSIGIKKYFKTPGWKGYRTDFDKLQPGDVALFSLKSHHALVAEVDGKNVKTIDGNAAYGEVNIHRRVLGKGAQHIIGYYSLDDLK